MRSMTIYDRCIIRTLLFPTPAKAVSGFTSHCVNRNVREFLLSDGDPNLDFKTLRTMYEQPYPLNIGQCLKAWTKLRYTGNNATGYVQRFQRAKREFEASMGYRTNFALESSVFLISIVDICWCQNFVQEFRQSTAQAMYDQFVATAMTPRHTAFTQPNCATAELAYGVYTWSSRPLNWAQFAKESPYSQPSHKSGSQWCPFHRRWVMHTPDSCRLAPAQSQLK